MSTPINFREVKAAWLRKNRIPRIVDGKSDKRAELLFHRCKRWLKTQRIEGWNYSQGELYSKPLLIGCPLGSWRVNRAQGPNVYAGADDKQHFSYILITQGLLSTVEWLSLSVWNSDTFLTGYGRLLKRVSTVQPTAIPKGLELLWLSANCELHEFDCPDVVPSWLNECEGARDSKRHQLYESCVVSAFDFLLLHEFGHLKYQHKSTLKKSGFDRLSQFNHSELEDGVARDGYDLRRAFEVEADRFAIRLILRELLPDALVNETNRERLVAAIVGVILVQVVFQAKRLVKGASRKQSDSLHPPLWFRTDSVLRILRKCSYDSWTTSGLKTSQWQSQQIKLEIAVFDSLLDLGNTHPLIGKWLGPTIENSRNEAGSTEFLAARERIQSITGQPEQ